MSTVLIKIGGSTVNSKGLLSELGSGIKLLVDDAISVTVVHGGGKDIAVELDKMNKDFTFIEGLRVTDKETMETVQRVLSGDVNKRIVNNFISEGLTAIGLSGVDANLLVAKKMELKGHDLGYVGIVEEVHTELLDLLFTQQMVPVISPVSRSTSGDIYNVNADLAASECAVAQQVDDLIYISDVPGVRISGAVRHCIKVDEIEQLIDEGEITGGMIPKMRSAADSLRRGVRRVHICGWRGATTLREELSHDTAQGTTIEI